MSLPNPSDSLPIRSTAELAAHLNLSRWTVSRALNGHPGVKADTRQRILDAVESLGFAPNPIARGLCGSRTGIVGICFQEMDSPIRARKAGALQTILQENGMRGVMELNGHRPELEREIIRHFIALRTDAIILFGSFLQQDDPLVEELLAGSIPVIAVDPAHPLPFASVFLNRSLAMESMLEHLHHLGHRRFALLGLDHDPVYGAQRREGLIRVCPRLGLDWKNSFEEFDLSEAKSLDYESGSLLMQSALNSDFEFSAVIALNDCIAIGAMAELHHRGFRLTEDYSVAGFDDIGVASWTLPSLTTVSQNTTQVMEATLELLQKLLNGEPPKQMEILPSLVIRDSTGPVPDGKSQF